MPLNQLPLLIALIVALGGVLWLLVRQWRSGTDAPPAQRATPVNPSEARPARANVRAPVQATAGASKPLSATTAAITSWGYQLQKFDPAHAAISPFDALVIDPTTDGSDATALTPDDLARLQLRPGGQPRTILAYLSIGEAESYRPYWDPQWKRDKPAWLLGENPEWKENYAVCFWHPGWQDLMCGSPEARLDRVLAAGFNGVYLDKCDVGDDLKLRFKTEAAGRPDLAADMVAFIARLSAYAKARNPHFLIVMQNAEDLLEHAELRACLDGVAKEELIFGADKPEKPNAAEDVEGSRALLDLMHHDGKLVLVVEYLNDPEKAASATAKIANFGYVPYIAPKNRKLDRLEWQAATV